MFHEDPAPGKQRGTNVTGEAIDVTNLGENKMYFKVYNVDPDKAAPLDQRSKISPSELLARIETLGRSYPLARVETEDFTVDGPKIGLNQLTDEAWVDGRGVLTQLAPLGLLSDKGLDNAPAQTTQHPAQTTQRPTQTTQRPTQTTQPRPRPHSARSRHAAPGPDQRPDHDDAAPDLVDALDAVQGPVDQPAGSARGPGPLRRQRPRRHGRLADALPGDDHLYGSDRQADPAQGPQDGRSGQRLPGRRNPNPNRSSRSR